MNKNTFSPSMTLAGMDYIAPSAACIKPTMMRTQQGSIEVSHTVGRHTHNDSDINNNHNEKNTEVSMDVRGSKALPTQPEIIKITLQDCLACSGCVTTAETILVNAQSREELLRMRAEQWNRANNTDVDAFVKSSEYVSDANATNATHNMTAVDIARTRKDDNGKEVHTNKSSMPPWLITISEQSASSIAAYLTCSVTEAYKIIAGFMYHVLTHHVPKNTNLCDIDEKTNINLNDNIPNIDRNSGHSRDKCTNVKENRDCGESNEMNNNTHYFKNIDTRLHTPINKRSCEHEVGHGAIYVSDLRWASRLSSQKTSEEYERRINNPNAECPLPLLVSACPGWVCYCEKQGATLLPHLCPVLSPQGLAGSLAKRLLGPNLYHVSVQPCFDRKLEAARDHVQRSELIRDYSTFSQKGKENINKFRPRSSSSYYQQEEEKEEEYEEEEQQNKLLQRESVVQSTEKCNNVVNQQSLQITPFKNFNTESDIAKTEKINNNKDDSKIEGGADCTVYYTDCVISTLELLEWMCEVDSTFPWRRELNSIDDVEDESEYKSLSFAALAPQTEKVQLKEEEHREEEEELQKQDTLHENKNLLSTNEMNVCDNKLASSSTWSKAKVQENTEDIALWEGSGGYHRHVIHYMLRKELNKRTSTSVKETLQTGEEACEEQEHSNNRNKVDSKELAVQRWAVDESMKSVRYEIKRNRNHQLITTPLLPKQTFCIAYGFQQIQNIVRGLRKRLPTVRSYTFVEMMACPEGCLNGGGQIRSKETCNNNTTERSFDEHEQFFTATKSAFAEHIMEQVVQSNKANNKMKKNINTQIKHNTRCNAKRTNSSNNTICEAESDVSNDNIRNDNTTINENCKICKIERHSVESDAGTLVLFSFASMSKFVAECGPASWLCKFTDRQKEFEQMLNEGNLQSLKW